MLQLEDTLWLRTLCSLPFIFRWYACCSWQSSRLGWLKGMPRMHQCQTCLASDTATLSLSEFEQNSLSKPGCPCALNKQKRATPASNFFPIWNATMSHVWMVCLIAHRRSALETTLIHDILNELTDSTHNGRLSILWRIRVQSGWPRRCAFSSTTAWASLYSIHGWGPFGNEEPGRQKWQCLHVNNETH